MGPNATKDLHTAKQKWYYLLPNLRRQLSTRDERRYMLCGRPSLGYIARANIKDVRFQLLHQIFSKALYCSCQHNTSFAERRAHSRNTSSILHVVRIASLSFFSTGKRLSSLASTLQHQRQVSTGLKRFPEVTGLLLYAPCIWLELATTLQHLKNNPFCSFVDAVAFDFYFGR